MPIAAQPKSSAMRTAAMYILHCSRIWASVRSVAGSVPVLNFIPRLSSHWRAFLASASVTRRMAATRADWLSRSL